MRHETIRQRVEQFMAALGSAVRASGRIFFTGGASAVLPGWRERSVFITQHGGLAFHHYDFYSQALAKTERFHVRDQSDVSRMIEDGWVKKARLRELFAEIKPGLIRYPAIAPVAFANRVRELTV